MDTQTYDRQGTPMKIGVPTIRIEIDPPFRLDGPLIPFIDVSPWQVVGSDGAGTSTVKIMWKAWEVGNNVDIHGGTLLRNSGSGNSGGEYSTGQGYISETMGHGVYGTVSPSKHSWLREAYSTVQQRFRRSGSGDGGEVRRYCDDAGLGVFPGRGPGARTCTPE